MTDASHITLLPRLLAHVRAQAPLVRLEAARIGETLARVGGLKVYPCPVAIPGFTVKQHWHARYHHDPGNRWLRGVCASLFLQRGVAGAVATPADTRTLNAATKRPRRSSSGTAVRAGKPAR